jgi:hypothetical protein
MAPMPPISDSIEADLRSLPARDATRTREQKKNYAEALSRLLATRLANGLRPYFDGIMPDPAGKRQESKARTSKGYKKLDINYSTTELGLGLGVSVKTINFIDPSTLRYTKNYTRVDNELRAEASDYHERQPYAVMVGVIFIPLDSCTDGKSRRLTSGQVRTTASSFAQAVHIFRHRANRIAPIDAPAKFERVFIALYDTSLETDFGKVRCFDVSGAPPKNGIPRSCLTMAQMLMEIIGTYDERNNTKVAWTDELSAPEDLDELIEIAQQTDEEEEE